MNAESINIIVSIIALALALFSIIFACIFYFKTNELYQGTNKNLTMISTLSEKIHKSQDEIIKDVLQLWKNDINSETDELIEEKNKIENDLIKETKNQINQIIKDVTIKNNENIEIKDINNKLEGLEKKISKITKNSFIKIEKAEKEYLVSKYRSYLKNKYELNDSELRAFEILYSNFKMKIFSDRQAEDLFKDNLIFKDIYISLFIRKLLNIGFLEKCSPIITLEPDDNKPREHYYVFKEIGEV